MSTVNVAVRNAMITQDPVMKQVGTTSLLTLNVGWKRAWKDKNGKQQEKKGFVELKVWGAAAEKAYQIAEKYGTVTCFGTLEMEQWQDRESGKTRYKHTISVEWPEWDSLFIFPPKPFEKQDEPPTQRPGGRAQQSQKDPWDEEKDGDGGPYGDEPNW